MNRLQRLFDTKKRNILSIYYTAGYPHLNDTLQIAQTLETAGVDFLEIGFPYSDSIADGPIIQASNKQALANGMTLETLFTQLKNMRLSLTIPVLLMGYFNVVLQYGVENFCKKCAEVGVDGCIIPDLPTYEYQKFYQSVFEKYGLSNIFLVTPQTAEDRIRKIDQLSDAFIYLISSSTITGNNFLVSNKAKVYFSRIQKMNLKNPLMIGFGIADKATFDVVLQYAQGAIIGSAFIKNLTDGNLTQQVTNFVKAIKNQVSSNAEN